MKWAWPPEEYTYPDPWSDHDPAIAHPSRTIEPGFGRGEAEERRKRALLAYFQTGRAHLDGYR